MDGWMGGRTDIYGVYNFVIELMFVGLLSSSVRLFTPLPGRFVLVYGWGFGIYIATHVDFNL